MNCAPSIVVKGPPALDPNCGFDSCSPSPRCLPLVYLLTLLLLVHRARRCFLLVFVLAVVLQLSIPRARTLLHSASRHSPYVHRPLKPAAARFPSTLIHSLPCTSSGLRSLASRPNPARPAFSAADVETSLLSFTHSTTTPSNRLSSLTINRINRLPDPFSLSPQWLQRFVAASQSCRRDRPCSLSLLVPSRVQARSSRWWWCRKVVSDHSTHPKPLRR